MRLTYSSKKHGKPLEIIPFWGWAQKPSKHSVKAYFLRYRLPDSKSVENHCKMMDFGGWAQKSSKASVKAYILRYRLPDSKGVENH